jgi:hypothetical protein
MAQCGREKSTVGAFDAKLSESDHKSSLDVRRRCATLFFCKSFPDLHGMAEFKSKGSLKSGSHGYSRCDDKEKF